MWVACKNYSHFYSKNTCELDIVLTRTVNILSTNKLIKLTMLWTTGPWTPYHTYQHHLDTSLFHFFFFQKDIVLIASDMVLFPTKKYHTYITYMFFFISPWKLCCWYLLKAPQWGTSNEYVQHVFVEKQEKYLPDTLYLALKSKWLMPEYLRYWFLTLDHKVPGLNPTGGGIQLIITKTCLYNLDPPKPHFYIVKLGFTGVCIIFLISAQKHRLWVLVRTASPRRF